jgi:ribosomal protein S18 acetylase RimI-like enzyme
MRDRDGAANVRGVSSRRAGSANADALGSNGGASANVICRPATQRDARAIAEAHVLAWQRAYAGVMPDSYLDGLSINDSEARWVELIATAQSGLTVVEHDGAVRGFSRCGRCRDPDAGDEAGEIYAINVHPDSWRQGLGSALLSSSLLDLASKGCDSAMLWVLEANESARRFYDSHGWELDGGHKLDSPRGCPALAHVRYWRDLAA